MLRPEPHVPVAVALSAAAAIGGIALASRSEWLATPAAAVAAGTAIALFGLPHGTLDLEILTQSRQAGTPRFVHVLLLYLAVAGAMAALWWAAPVAALIVFLGIAVVHFAEDWATSESPFLEHGTALALLSAPSLLHRPAIGAIFAALTGVPDAALVGDALLVLAPVAGVVAVAAMAAMVANGAARTAVAAGVSLAAMLLLPPVAGFAVFFCLFHSPRHFSAALRQLGWSRPRRWLPVVVPVTAAALALDTLAFELVPTGAVPARLIAAVFMTLSVLTLPHLAVPVLLRLSRALPQPRANPISAGH